MVKIVLGIAAVLMLASAFFEFQARSKITGAVNERIAAQDTAKRASDSLGKAQSDAKAAQEQLAAANQKADAAAGELNTAKADAQKAADQVKNLQAQLDEANTKLASAPTNPTNPNATSAPDPRVAELETRVKDAETKLAEAQTVINTQRSKADEAESRARTLEQQERARRGGLMRPGIEGQVLAVNPSWNFVVLSLGDHQGAAMNAELVIVRGGERIGRVRITSVEPSTSVADVIPGSTARGVRIQPGDRVIFPGSQAGG